MLTMLHCCRHSLAGAVLVIHADTSGSGDVETKLKNTGAFSKVDLFNAGSGTPTLAQLQNYGAVLVYASNVFQDPTTMGDNLADYFDGGGHVVLAVFALMNYASLAGRWASGGYDLIQPQPQENSQVNSPLIFDEPNSPLVAGVTSLTAVSAFRNYDGAIINGGVVVARWGDNTPLIVRGVKGTGNLVALNFYPPSAQSSYANSWVGSGAVIMRNALRY